MQHPDGILGMYVQSQQLAAFWPHCSQNFMHVSATPKIALIIWWPLVVFLYPEIQSPIILLMDWFVSRIVYRIYYSHLSRLPSNVVLLRWYMVTVIYFPFTQKAFVVVLGTNTIIFTESSFIYCLVTDYIN